MDQTSQDDSKPTTIEDLVAALIEMRDSLTLVSLALHDYRFDLEANRRQLPIEQFREIFEKLKS